MSAHPVESLSAFLDDELEDAQRRGVEAHLAACPSCARHLRELAAVDALARGLPPAGAPDGYLEALPGRVRRRIRANRPPAARAPWVWPLAAGLALAVLAPIVLRQQRSHDSPPPDRPPVAMELPAAPPPAATPDERTPAAAPPSKKLRDAFAAPPPAARPNESERGAPRASGGVVGRIVDTPPAAAPPAEQDALAAAGRGKEERAESADALAEQIDASPSLKKVDAPRQNAAESKREAPRRSEATPQDERSQIQSGGAPRRSEATRQDERRRIHSGGADDEKTFQDNASLPASTVEEARRAREAWRRFVTHHASGRRADEGRVRFIESAVAVFRLTGDEGDRAIAEREGRAYLAVPGAPQASRVRVALSHLDDRR